MPPPIVVQMRDTTLQRYTVAGLGSPNPTTVAKASTSPLRVLVRNIGGPAVFLAMDVGSLSTTNGPTSTAYLLPPGIADAFIIAPYQSLYAMVGVVGSGDICAAISEAIFSDKF